MRVGGQHFRTIWLKTEDERVVQLIDQRFLPHRFVIEEVATVEQMRRRSAICMFAERGDRRERGLRDVSRDNCGRRASHSRGIRSTPGQCSGTAQGNPADGGESCLGNRAPAKEYRRGKNFGREDRPGSAHSQTNCPRRCGALPDDRRARVESHSANCSKESRQADQRAHPLQRGMARVR